MSHRLEVRNQCSLQCRQSVYALSLSRGKVHAMLSSFSEVQWPSTRPADILLSALSFLLQSHSVYAGTTHARISFQLLLKKDAGVVYVFATSLFITSKIKILLTFRLLSLPDSQPNSNGRLHSKTWTPHVALPVANNLHPALFPRILLKAVRYLQHSHHPIWHIC